MACSSHQELQACESICDEEAKQLDRRNAPHMRSTSRIAIKPFRGEYFDDPAAIGPCSTGIENKY